MGKSLNLYFIRHGETLFNVKQYAQGWCDSPLTSNGISSAKSLGQRFKEESIEFDKIYTSPFTRAYDTTKLIMNEMGLTLPIICDDLLKEVNFGIWEGEIDYIRFKSMGNPLFTDNITYEDGESHDALYERIKSFLYNITQENDSGNILIVTHGVWTMMLLSRMFNWDLKANGGIKNASITQIKYEDGKFTPILIGDKKVD